jgi:hypothetical protein
LSAALANAANGNQSSNNETIKHRVMVFSVSITVASRRPKRRLTTEFTGQSSRNQKELTTRFA